MDHGLLRSADQNLVEIVADEGVNGKTLNRMGLTRFVSLLAPGRILVALKLDRLTRGGTRGLDVKRKNRERLGTTPLGFVTVQAEAGSRRVETDTGEMETVALAWQLQLSRLSLILSERYMETISA